MEIYWSNLLVLAFFFIFTLLKNKSGQNILLKKNSGQNIIMTHGPNTIYIYIYISLKKKSQRKSIGQTY